MISIIIVDYKTANRTIKYIMDFCHSSNNKDISFVIVDNTPDNSNSNAFVECATRYFDNNLDNNLDDGVAYFYKYENIDIVYYTNYINHGFAKANNIGFELAKKIFNPDQVLFSNSDIILPTYFDLNYLSVKLREIEKEYGMIGPNVKGLDGKNQGPYKKLGIYKKYIIPSILWPLNKLLPFLKKMDSDIIVKECEGEVYRIIGAFMLFDINVFEKIHYFDENTFLYAEESILSEKLKKFGLKVFYTNKVSIIHEQGVSTTDISKKKIDNLIIKKSRMIKSDLYYYRNYLNVSKFTILLAKISFGIYKFKLKICSIFVRKKGGCSNGKK